MPTTKKKKSTKKSSKTKKAAKRVVRKSAKKVAKKPAKANKKPVKKGTKSKQKEKLIGKVTHYFDKIKVAVIKLKAPLKVDEKIRIVGGEVDFTQKVKSMEVEHKRIKRAKAKQEIGLKVKDKVRDGYRVYKIY